MTGPFCVSTSSRERGGGILNSNVALWFMIEPCRFLNIIDRKLRSSSKTESSSVSEGKRDLIGSIIREIFLYLKFTKYSSL